MRIQCDTLKYARLLRKKGVQSESADDFMSTLTQIEIFNLYSKHEVDSMLSESIEKVFAKHDRYVEKAIAEQRREFDQRMQIQKEQLQENRQELLVSRRWMIGTMITIGLSLAAYLSALLHFNH